MIDQGEVHELGLPFVPRVCLSFLNDQCRLASPNFLLLFLNIV